MTKKKSPCSICTNQAKPKIKCSKDCKLLEEYRAELGFDLIKSGLSTSHCRLPRRSSKGAI